MDVEILSRIQFAFTVAFHYIYPPLSIGLGVVLVLLEAQFLRTRDPQWEQLTRFWVRIFALIFGIGVATGIVMEFEFGTNWATYSRYVGDIFGSALAAEGIFAFALESGFLGILIFGWNRVSPKVHFLSTIMVALGSMFSAIWIVVANSWMQTPAGYTIEGEGMQARAVVTDFWAMVFNPSSVDRLVHVLLGSLLAGSFLVISVHAWYLLRGRFVEHSKKALRPALWVATLAALAQLFSGHRSADLIAHHQPAKLAAFEGHFDSLAPADMYIFGMVDKKTETTTGLAVPGMLSWLLYQDVTAPVKGLKAFPDTHRPSQVNAVFQFYHIMISIGMALIGLTVVSMFMLWRRRLYTQRWLLYLLMWAVLLPQIANQSGWFAAEMGRQPWVVYGLLRTSEALSKAVSAEHVWFSLILFTGVYALLFVLFIYLLNKKIVHGPVEEHMPELIPDYSKRPGAIFNQEDNPTSRTDL